MAVTTVTGATFTFKIGATAYSSQITDGTIVQTPTLVRTKTLGDVAFTQTDFQSSATVNFLFDDETGFYGALNTAAQTGAVLAVVITGGDVKWSGNMYVDGDISTSYTADGIATCSASFIGTLVVADAP